MTAILRTALIIFLNNDALTTSKMVTELSTEEGFCFLAATEDTPSPLLVSHLYHLYLEQRADDDTVIKLMKDNLPPAEFARLCNMGERIARTMAKAKSIAEKREKTASPRQPAAIRNMVRRLMARSVLRLFETANPVAPDDQTVRKVHARTSDGWTAPTDLQFTAVSFDAYFEHERHRAMLLGDGYSLAVKAGFALKEIARVTPGIERLYDSNTVNWIPQEILAQMSWMPTGQIQTLHTTNKVFIVQIKARRNVSFARIADIELCRHRYKTYVDSLARGWFIDFCHSRKDDGKARHDHANRSPRDNPNGRN